MRKRFTKQITCVVILFLIFLPCLAFAQTQDQLQVPEGQQGQEKQECAEPSISNIAQELGLSSKQKAQLKEQKFQESYNRMDTRNKIRLKKLELRHELEKEAINQEVINQVVIELKELQGISIEQRVASILKLREILTPEQFEKLGSLGMRKMHQGKQTGHQSQGLKNRSQDFKNQ